MKTPGPLKYISIYGEYPLETNIWGLLLEHSLKGFVYLIICLE